MGQIRGEDVLAAKHGGAPARPLEGFGRYTVNLTHNSQHVTVLPTAKAPN